MNPLTKTTLHIVSTNLYLFKNSIYILIRKKHKSPKESTKPDFKLALLNSALKQQH